MRYSINPQQHFGQVFIKDIVLDLESRDDLVPVLLGIQLLHANAAFMAALLELLRLEVQPHVDKGQGRPGMDLWAILVLGLVKQALGLDYDRLHMLANSHHELRQFLGHSDIWDRRWYRLRTLVDNVNLLTPELLGKISRLVVEHAHAMAGKAPLQILFGRGDSFVVKTDVHWPTDLNLLWDAIRSSLGRTARLAKDHKVPGWRKWKQRKKNVKALFNLVRTKRRDTEENAKQREMNVKAYLATCKSEAAFIEETIRGLRVAGVDCREIREVERFLGFANILSDQIRRRVLEGEKIPHEEKIFSIYETHTRWISKGKAGCPVELGVPICIIEDQYGHILHVIVMWEGTDKDYTVKLVKEAQERFPGLRVVSFDRGFHSPENQVELDKMLDFNAMPKKGKLNEAERARRNDPLFKKMANWHSGIESCINNLEQRGMDRVLSYGADGFERMVNLSVLALNVHRVGLTELRRLQEERKKEEKSRRRRLRAA